MYFLITSLEEEFLAKVDFFRPQMYTDTGKKKTISLCRSEKSKACHLVRPLYHLPFFTEFSRGEITQAMKGEISLYLKRTHHIGGEKKLTVNIENCED